MTIKLSAAALLAAPLFLAACGQPTTITTGAPSDPTANQVAAAPPVKLPPAVLASKTYRCKDNSVVYVDFMNDSTTANLKTKKDGAATALTAAAAGKPYEGGGYTVTGQATDATVQVKKPGGAAQPCDA